MDFEADGGGVLEWRLGTYVEVNDVHDVAHLSFRKFSLQPPWNLSFTIQTQCQTHKHTTYLFVLHERINVNNVLLWKHSDCDLIVLPVINIISDSGIHVG